MQHKKTMFFKHFCFSFLDKSFLQYSEEKICWRSRLKLLFQKMYVYMYIYIYIYIYSSALYLLCVRVLSTITDCLYQKMVDEQTANAL